MHLRLRNDWEYQGNDRWDWTVFLEDDGSGDIDTVISVEYVLHPTFPNPRKVKTNKSQNFRMRMNGWGVFLIRAFANTVGGEKIRLEHQLELRYDPPIGTTE
ncbi:pYEATS domain-containing protein [Lewinella sp. IMCC34183]|uniref:pYEATS domain-containing protein n=1 Tax=Lewinella sp. IMCC34183 TaxID=2248762 RepID=UPI000E262A72